MPARTKRPPSILKQRSSVGDDVATLSTHVMYPEGQPPIEAQAWDGWPVEWNLPYYEAHGFGTYWNDPATWSSRVAVVGTCADFNARQLATMPIYGVDVTLGERVELPSWAWNPEPEQYASWQEFAREAITSLQIHGEAFIYATSRFASGFPSRFVTLHPDTVNVERSDGRIVYLLGEQPLPAGDVLHVKYASLPLGLRGIGPLEWVGRSLVSAEALEKYATDIAKNGVSALLKHPANISKQQADDLKSSWIASRQNANGAPAVLPGGIEYEQLTLDPKSMALLDIRTYDEQRIAAAFGVPPFLVGLPQPNGLVYQNVGAIYDGHWRSTLRPMAQQFASALSGWALPRNRMIEFNRDEYVRPDFEGRARAYQTMHSIEDDGRPAVTVDEIRAAERFDVAPGYTKPADLPGGLRT